MQIGELFWIISLFLAHKESFVCVKRKFLEISCQDTHNDANRPEKQFGKNIRLCACTYGAHFFRSKCEHWRHRAQIVSFAFSSKNFQKNWYPGVFRVAEYEFTLKIRKSENTYSGVFEVSDYESELNIQKFKISDAIWRIKMQKEKSYAAKGSLRRIFFRWTVLRTKVYIGIFWVADYESDLRFLIFNIADPIWQQKIEKIMKFCCEFL